MISPALLDDTTRTLLDDTTRNGTTERSRRIAWKGRNSISRAFLFLRSSIRFADVSIVNSDFEVRRSPLQTKKVDREGGGGPMRRPMKTMLLSAALVLPAFAAAGQTAEEIEQILIDELRDVISDTAKDGNLAAVYQAYSFFGASPGISGAAYELEENGVDTDISLFKLPISFELKPSKTCVAAAYSQGGVESPDVASGSIGRLDVDPTARCIRPYLELSLSYLRIEEEAVFSEAVDVDLDLRSYSALAGAGVSIPLTTSTVFRPILLFGYSHVDDKSKASGAEAELFEDLFGGLITGVEIDSLYFGGALELSHRRRIRDDLELDASVRYNHVLSDVVSASDDALEQANDFGALAGNAELNKRTSLTFFSRDVHLLGSLGGTYFPGQQGEQLGSRYYYELGTGVEIKDDGIIPGVGGIKIFGRFILGDDVTGYKFGASLTF